MGSYSKIPSAAIAVLSLFSLGAGGGVLELPSLSASASYYQDVVLSNNPTLYWRLGDTSSPAVNLGSLGAAGNGTYGSTTLLNQPSLISNSGGNGAATFASGGGLTTSNVSRNPLSSFPSGSFSVEYWFRGPNSSATSNNGAGFASYNTAGTENAMLIGNPDAVRFLVNNNTFQSTVDISDNNLHHFVVVFDNTTGTARFYDNGSQVFSQTNGALIGASVPSGGSLILGQEQDNPGFSLDPNQALDGTLDEFAIYPFAMSASDILMHYGIGIGAIQPPIAPEPMSIVLVAVSLIGLVLSHRWRMRRRASRATM